MQELTKKAIASEHVLNLQDLCFTAHQCSFEGDFLSAPSHRLTRVACNTTVNYHKMFCLSAPEINDSPFSCFAMTTGEAIPLLFETSNPSA
jgi:hypothetical protein